ncbi:hypothetical protein H2204_005009 [Knufia peltigerae]|uniref:Uncharacterized protein n=1 Tax=Knufia peltigerae TaxID=1002370 RepID=A0AA39CY43_9EURO|nr:hypothetical protein H2204_005009 [Knufia peltigerae]
MPSRKKIKPPSKFYFVTLQSESDGSGWRMKRSHAARSHAAYWGGPAQQQHEANKDALRQEKNIDSINDAADKIPSVLSDSKVGAFPLGPMTMQRRRSARAEKIKDTYAKPMGTSRCPKHIQPNYLQYLVPAPLDLQKTVSLSTAFLPMFKFFGQQFVQKFITSDHEDYLIMLSGCLLLSYAHTMALTGQGNKTKLLQLKSQVIQRISAKIKSSGNSLSPRSLTGILALGAPIVCLTSQDLPQSLSMWEYINASQQGDFLCCRDSAETAKRALDERLVHRQAMRNLFSRSSATFQDVDSIHLLGFVSNYMNVSLAIDAADHMDTPLANIEDLFPTLDDLKDTPLPAQWTSPLTHQWHCPKPITQPDSEMVTLADLIHCWLATFVDGDGNSLSPTDELLMKRAELRRKAEIHTAAARPPRTELEAIGLLFWVAAICQFSTVGQCFPLLCTTLFARFAQELAMSEDCAQIAVKPLKGLKQFEGLCCQARR